MQARRLAEVLGVANPLLHMAEIMEQALDIALDKKDLKRKHARRLERKSKTSPPFALHHSHDERFLRLHCGPHNRLAAERVFEVAFIQGKIDAARRNADSS